MTPFMLLHSEMDPVSKASIRFHPPRFPIDYVIGITVVLSNGGLACSCTGGSAQVQASRHYRPTDAIDMRPLLMRRSYAADGNDGPSIPPFINDSVSVWLAATADVASKNSATINSLYGL